MRLHPLYAASPKNDVGPDLASSAPAFAGLPRLDPDRPDPSASTPATAPKIDLGGDGRRRPPLDRKTIVVATLEKARRAPYPRFDALQRKRSLLLRFPTDLLRAPFARRSIDWERGTRARVLSTSEARHFYFFSFLLQRPRPLTSATMVLLDPTPNEEPMKSPRQYDAVRIPGIAAPQIQMVGAFRYQDRHCR